jgi:hypothetical protein
VSRTWHQALAYAMTGQRLDGLGGEERLELATLARTLLELQRTGHVDLASSAAQRHAVPADLLGDIGPAQFWAAQSELAGMLAAGRPGRRSPVVTDRPLTPEERRLTDDTPPHHGS